jgi:lysophospholipase L1-like esterase
MKKLIAVNLAVAALLVLVPLVILELYLRATVPPSSSESIYTYTLATPRYKVMKANAAVTAWGKEFRTNELGFRDRPIGPKQPGEFRIVVLGDSFTVSAGVEFADIYTARLEKLLGARVINLGVGGYNIAQYAMVLQEVGLALEPDLVLVAVFPDNDFSNDTYEANFRVAAGRADPEPEPAWYEKLYVHRAYGTRLQSKLNAIFPPKSAPAPQKTSGWEQNVAALRAIAAMTESRGIRLKVAILPHTWNFEKQRPLFAQVLKECAAIGLTCRDLLESFIARRLPEPSLRLNPLDAHPNERYNAVVAEELAASLKSLVKPRGVVRTSG